MAEFLISPTVRDKLTAFLDRSARHAFAWGQHDCMLDVADWLDYACGLDAAARWRGEYASEAQAQSDPRMVNGLVSAMREEAMVLGLAETGAPEAGDIAVVSVAGQDKPVGAIMMPSGKWRMRTLTGFLITRDVTVLVAWSLPCRPSSPQLS